MRKLVFPRARLRGQSSLAFAMLLVGLFAFIGLAYVSQKSLSEVISFGEADRRSLENLDLIEQTLSLLKDIETGQRGFVITGNDEFLEPYRSAHGAFESTYLLMRDRLIADQVGYGKRLDRLIYERLTQAERNITDRKRVGAEIIKDTSRFVAGKSVMDEIRSEFDRLRNAQSDILSRRHAEVSHMERQTRALETALGVVGCVLLVISIAFLALERVKRDRAESELRTLNAMLETSVASRTSELTSALVRIKSFAQELNQSIEDERRRLAREVHDQLGQIFTALKMLVTGLRLRPSEGLRDDTMHELTELLDEGVNVSRQIASQLRPPLLDDLGLAAAIGHHAQTLTRHSDLRINVEIQEDRALDPDQASQLFRIVQEALTNVMRHSRANEVHVIGARTDTGYRLQVDDNGIGPGDVRADASGLRNMSERASMMGGSFSFGPGDDSGTVVTVTIPST